MFIILKTNYFNCGFTTKVRISTAGKHIEINTIKYSQTQKKHNIFSIIDLDPIKNNTQKLKLKRANPDRIIFLEK